MRRVSSSEGQRQTFPVCRRTAKTTFFMNQMTTTAAPDSSHVRRRMKVQQRADTLETTTSG